MSNLVKALLGLSALAFVLAVVTHFAGPIVGTHAEGYSRGCESGVARDCLGPDVRRHGGRRAVALDYIAFRL